MSVLLTISILCNPYAVKADVVSDVINQVMSITCETQAIANLGGYTCINDTIVGAAIANIISFPTYGFAMMHGNMNNNDLFHNNCTTKASPTNPTINFGFCSDLDLVPLKVVAAAKVTRTLATSLLNGSLPSDQALQQAWQVSPSEYFETHNVSLTGSAGVYSGGSSGTFIDAVAIIPWQVLQVNDRICVATIGATGAWVPFGCKYISEPYPTSRYSGFFDGNGGSDPLVQTFNSCISQGSCHSAARAASKTILSISGPLIACIKMAIIKMLISQVACEFSDAATLANSPIARDSSTLVQFQRHMRLFVSGCLTLYTIFMGFRVILGGELPQRGEIISYLIKLICVIYFSVGLTNQQGTFDGMTEYVLPFLLDGAGELASWALNADQSGLCAFSPSDYTDPHYTYLTTWDALDCRLYHYLGLGYTIPAYMYLVVPAVYYGQMDIAMLILSYPIMVISVSAFMVSSFIISMVCIAILGVLAPLFIPMVLFDYTKGYFESWVKLLISFMLQPMILAVFMSLMFTVFDRGFYNGCQYVSSTNNVGQKTFNIATDPSVYADQSDYNKCMVSLGWMLNSTSLDLSFGNVSVSPAGAANAAQSSSINPGGPAPVAKSSAANALNILNMLDQSQGFFFKIVTLNWQDLQDLVLSLLCSCMLLYVMYHISAQIGNFATDMTEGISIAGMNPIDAQSVMKAAQFAKNAASSARGGGKAGAAGKAAPNIGRGISKSVSQSAGGGGGDQKPTAPKGSGS